MLRKFLVAGFLLVLAAVLAALWWRLDGEPPTRPKNDDIALWKSSPEISLPE